jgi:hypothetical protein
MNPTHRAAWGLLIVASSVALAACGSASSAASPTGGSTPSGATVTSPSPNAVESNPSGDIPDNQAFVAYQDPAGRFTVTVPEGWARSSDGTATVFTDKYNSIRLESRPTSSAATVASAQATDVPAIQASARGFAAGKVTTATRKAGRAILITYGAQSPVNAVTGKVTDEAVERYAFWRGGYEVIITLAAPVGSDNVDPWRKVTDSFTWLT